MTPAEFAADLHRRADALPGEVAEAVELTAQDALTRARWWSSGSLSLKQMRRKSVDHPYARRHGSPKLNPDFINTQTGVFAASWRHSAPVEDAEGNLTAAVFNTDPKAPYLEQPDGGPNSKMFARHPHEQVAAEVAPRFEQRVALALTRVLEG